MRFFAWKENFAKADALIVENRPLPMFLCRVLASRGIKDSASAETFLNCTQPLCDPMELHDMEKAVTIVRRAIDEGKKILVFGDYDCDGITATVLLYEYLEGEGADVCYYIPERLNEGYGLSMKTMEMVISSGIELIITVDNGISAVEEIKRAKEAGIEVAKEWCLTTMRCPSSYHPRMLWSIPHLRKTARPVGTCAVPPWHLS